MEENNRKGPGVFYAVVGVATLVVAIIGATFAFFSASATVTGNENITGTTAEAVSLGVAVAKVNPTSAELNGKLERLVPLNSADDMGSALSNGCIDDNGYTACQVYSVTITSTGAEKVIATPTVQLAGTFTNLKWQLLTGASKTDFALDGTFNAVENTTSKALGNVEVTSAAPKVLYFVVWLENLNESQNAEAGQTYTGTVTVNATDAIGNAIGGQLSATFSA